MVLSGKQTKNVKFRADMHTHTNASPDSSCPIEDICAAEIKKGMNAFAITDHFNIEAKGTGVDFETPVVKSFENANKMKNLLQEEVEILCGVEVGSAMWDREAADRMLKRFDFDVVIGSVHTIITDVVKCYYSAFDFTTITLSQIDVFLTAYFEELLNTALYCDFDILAHINCPERYINGKYRLGVDFMKYEEYIREILKAIIRRGKALELNTSNNTFCKGFFMPDAKILSIYRGLGGELLTIGSDAHAAENACIAFSEAEELLKEIGFSELCCFRRRKAFTYEI